MQWGYSRTSGKGLGVIVVQAISKRAAMVTGHQCVFATNMGCLRDKRGRYGPAASPLAVGGEVNWSQVIN